MINPTNGCCDADDHNKGIFSCDLMTNATKHLQFLKSIHEYYVTSNDTKCHHGSHESLRRYQELWLPLVAAVTIKANTGTALSMMEQLYPPPDIAWLWHCHRLAPKHYMNYCHQTFDGRTLEAHPPFEMAHPNLGTSATEPVPQQVEPKRDGYFQRTLDLWTEMYPHESFFLDVDKETKAEAPLLLNGFDLLGSTERQATFLWQVSGERFGDDDFLTDGVLNYYRFLQLKQNATKLGTILVPTYQIDLMWHTHILSSIEMYNKDCIRIMNSTMHHDDSLTDREEGGILDVSFTATKSLWMKHYGTEYIIAGGMYRGEPPPEFFTSQWRSYEDSLPSMVTNMTLVGTVGASSTGKTAAVPSQWAPLDGPTSDGRPAFIKSAQQTKQGIRSLKYKTDYVLGRYGNHTGYYHIETKPANEILKTRVDGQLLKIESKIAFQKGCCGSIRSTQALENKRNELLQCQSFLRGRFTRSTGTTQIGSSSVSDCDTCIYPPILFSSAGGACGGMVCSHAGGGSGMFIIQRFRILLHLIL